MRKLDEMQVEFDRVDSLERDELKIILRRITISHHAADICNQLIGLGNKEFKRKRKGWLKIMRDLLLAAARLQKALYIEESSGKFENRLK